MLDCPLGAPPAAQVSVGTVSSLIKTKEKGTAEAQSLQHLISHLPAGQRLPGSLHLLAKGDPSPRWQPRAVLARSSSSRKLSTGMPRLLCSTTFPEQVQDIVLLLLINRRNDIDVCDSGNTAETHDTSLTGDDLAGPHLCSSRFRASARTAVGLLK